jgi:uncharacterized surface protein with fasciclin (FAS1) repeats
MSDLNIVDLLKQINHYNIVRDGGQKLSFDKFLIALNKAGLVNRLSSGTYLIFAPTTKRSRPCLLDKSIH